MLELKPDCDARLICLDFATKILLFMKVKQECSKSFTNFSAIKTELFLSKEVRPVKCCLMNRNKQLSSPELNPENHAE